MRLFVRVLKWGVLCGALSGLPLAGMTQTAPAAQATASGNWKQLKAHEQRTLAPLAAKWGELTETQRSKWLAISQHFDKLSPAEQQVMQARMTEWVALSPVQRNQARLNFNTVQGLSKDEKKNRWDEYQALSEAEKRKLSAGALAPARTAAPSPKPASQDRLVQPTVRTVPPAALPPRAPIDRKTLLPVPAASSPADNPPAQPSAPSDAVPAQETHGS
jgi:Protein of unknown function (DUF3106)